MASRHGTRRAILCRRHFMAGFGARANTVLVAEEARTVRGVGRSILPGPPTTAVAVGSCTGVQRKRRTAGCCAAGKGREPAYARVRGLSRNRPCAFAAPMIRTPAARHDSSTRGVRIARIDIDIEYDDRAVISALDRLLQADRDLTPAMRRIAVALLDSVEEAFTRRRRPKAYRGHRCRTSPSPPARSEATGQDRSCALPATCSTRSPPTSTRRAPPSSRFLVCSSSRSGNYAPNDRAFSL